MIKGNGDTRKGKRDKVLVDAGKDAGICNYIPKGYFHGSLILEGSTWSPKEPRSDETKPKKIVEEPQCQKEKL